MTENASNIIQAANRFERQSGTALQKSLHSGGKGLDNTGDPPGGDHLKQRVEKLETAMFGVRNDLSDIKTTLARIEAELAHKPSYGAMLGIMIALVGLVAAAAFGGASVASGL